mgnify:CR=1 FL=1
MPFIRSHIKVINLISVSFYILLFSLLSYNIKAYLINSSLYRELNTFVTIFILDYLATSGLLDFT